MNTSATTDSGPLSDISPFEYESFRVYLEEACGILLGMEKQYLVKTRLSKLMEQMQLKTLTDLVTRAKFDTKSGLRDQIVDAMTTNETLWFRDVHPYNILKEYILPEFVAAGKKPVRIWSAACSSGQEPYSIGISIHEYLAVHPGYMPQDFQILGTDIAPTILFQAMSGMYDGLGLTRGLDTAKRDRFFAQQGDKYKINTDIRNMVTFKVFNLQDTFLTIGRQNVIFCRNVLIYFSDELKKIIVNRMIDLLEPGGFLFIGASESLFGVTSALQTVQTQGGVVYKKE